MARLVEAVLPERVGGIRIAPVNSVEDYRAVLELRLNGYKRFFTALSEAEDPLDSSPHGTVYLARDSEGRPLGTLRALSSAGGIELGKHVNVDSFLAPSEQPTLESTRFVVLPTEHRLQTKMLLWKTFWLHAKAAGCRTMLLSARKGAREDYEFLLFTDVGPNGCYQHTKLGGLEHRTLKLNVESAPGIYRAIRHPLERFLVWDSHPNIHLPTHFAHLADREKRMKD